jgi:hypothetical protein
MNWSLSGRTTGSLAVAALLASPVASDEIILKGGGRVSGRVVEQSEARVAIETGPGRVTLPMSRVVRIVEGRSALEAFAERASGLAPHDSDAWAELARWAEQRELLTQARLAWQRVLAADPSHGEANAALGRVLLDGEWLSADDASRARGLVAFEGRWLTPMEHEAAVRERAAAEAATLEAREADLRVREAEARAREAEARAREAEAAADQSASGIPLWYAYGGGTYGGGYGGFGPVQPGYGPLRPSHRSWPGKWRNRAPHADAPAHPGTTGTRPRSASPRAQPQPPGPAAPWAQSIQKAPWGSLQGPAGPPGPPPGR